jgi:thymidine kinase
MFIEPLMNQNFNTGWIEVICGPMFSGKTEELIRRLKRAKIANKKVAIFKPDIDIRYSADEVVSHNSTSISSIRIKRPIDLLAYYDDAEVIGIDEVQFFSDKITEVIVFLAIKGKRVIVAGLDMDSNGKPFGPMPSLLAVAEYVTKLHAICIECGMLANHTYRLSEETDLVVIGTLDKYMALCRHCFNKKNEQKDLTVQDI